MLVESSFLQALSLAKLALLVDSSSQQVSGAFPVRAENLEVTILSGVYVLVFIRAKLTLMYADLGKINCYSFFYFLLRLFNLWETSFFHWSRLSSRN